MPETLNVPVMYNAYWVHLSPHPSIINEALLGRIDEARGWRPVTNRGQRDREQGYLSRLRASLHKFKQTQNVPLIFKSIGRGPFKMPRHSPALPGSEKD